jgi:putative PIN family toxin of toxin-antitoxin system
MMRASDGETLRVVLDTNVYISMFTQPDRPIYQIWEQAVRRHYHLLISRAILDEVADVLRTDFGWNDRTIVQHLKLLARAGEIITPTVTLNVIPEDPDDDRILECAVEGRANLIVSGDRHLRRLRIYQNIPVVRPADFLRILGLQ